MKRHIFVGSSTEALEQARHVCKILSNIDDVEAELWTDVFDPGFLTFEVLEAMLRRCCAAVFIVSAEDQTLIRDKLVQVPRANIMLEFGLVAGRLGHHSVAVCQYGKPELPSDLAGLTVIHMDPPDGDPAPDVFQQQAEKKLQIWSSRLLATASGISRTDVVHGYTGRWDFDLALSVWRDRRIIAPSYATVKGYLDLFLMSNGQVGRGLAHGRMQFRLLSGSPGVESYSGEFRTAHEIRNAVCARDGSLELITEAFALEKMETSGAPPLELAEMDRFPEPWCAQWKLTPNGEFALSGTVKSQGTIATEGTVVTTKRMG